MELRMNRMLLLSWIQVLSMSNLIPVPVMFLNEELGLYFFEAYVMGQPLRFSVPKDELFMDIDWAQDAVEVENFEMTILETSSEDIINICQQMLTIPIDDLS